MNAPRFNPTHVRWLRTIVAWALTLVLAVGYLSAGYGKLVLTEPIIEQFTAFGYSLVFARVIGIVESTGALLLLVPRLAVYGSAAIGLEMAGAIATHVATGIGSPFHASRNLALLLVLAALRWKHRLRTRSSASRAEGTVQT